MSGYLAAAQACFFGALFIAVFTALWKGGSPERLGASIILAMSAIQAIAAHFTPPAFAVLDIGSLLTDLAGFLSFSVLALSSRRNWPVWCASWQSAALCVHVARWLSSDLSEQAYAVLRAAPTFLALISIFAGTLLHLRRLNLHQTDPAWRSS